MAQNLVSNGYFETYSPCPTAMSSQGNMQINYALGWTQSTLTPDYFNSCSGIGNSVDVPYSFIGYQKDCCGGNGFAGGYLLDANSLNNDDRDYIQTHLNDTIRAGHKYLASMYLSRADFNYAIATAGMLFTDTSTYLNWPQGFISATPQVLNSTRLQDTLNWILVQDTFTAMNNCFYLTIGNFNTNATSDSIRSAGSWGYYDAAYYYIDGVSVYDVTSGGCNNLWDAGFDKYVFSGDSVKLGAVNTDNSSFIWQNSIGGNTFLSSNTDARPWASPTVTTTYYAAKTCPDNTLFQDTITVHVQQHVGITDVLSKEQVLMVYPNPNNGSMVIRYVIKNNAVLEISDVSGKLVGKYSLAASANSLNITNDKLENGVYFYHLSDGNANHTGKIVIMK